MMENNTNEENFSGVTPENNNTLEMPNTEATESNINNETNIGIATAIENGMNQNTTIGFEGVTPTNSLGEIGFSNISNSSGNKSSWLLAIVGGLLVVFIGFFVFYINTMGNPKNVFTNIINRVFDSAENILSSQFNFEESALIEGNVKIDSNIDEVAAVNKETYNYTFGYDLKNKKAELSAGVKVDNKDRLTAALNIKDNNIYVYLNELFDKVIKVDEDMIKDTTGMTINEIFETIEETLSKEKTDDMLYIVKEMKKITNKAFKNAEYEKTSDIVDVNGKEIKATKMTLEFNTKNNELIFGKIIDEMLKNDTLLTKIAELSYSESIFTVTNSNENATEELKKDLVESLKEAKNDLALAAEEIDEEEAHFNDDNEEEDYPSISIYTGGLFNKIIKFSAEEYGEEISSYIDYKDTKIIETDEIKIIVEKDILTVYEDGEEIVTGKVNSLEMDNIDITFKTVSDDINVEGKFKYLNEKDNLVFDLDFNYDSEFDLEINFNNKKVNEKEYNNKIGVKVTVGEEYVKVTNDATLYLGKDIAVEETDTAKINLSELTEQDLTNIINKLDQYEDVFVISSIKDIVMLNMNQTNDSYYDDDYYYNEDDFYYNAF